MFNMPINKIFARADGKPISKNATIVSETKAGSKSTAFKGTSQMKPIVHNTAALNRGQAKMDSQSNKKTAKGSNLKRSMGV